MSTDDQISLRVEFTGGLELLFSNQRSHNVTIPAFVSTDGSSVDGSANTKPVDINYLLRYLRDNLLKERVEFFMENNTIRPGILVLINDSDWELDGEGDYQLRPGDEIVFISTLHGG